MARRSSTREILNELEAWASLRRQGPRPAGSGADYRLFRSLPQSPPAAKFLRQFVTLRDALLRLRAENRKDFEDQKQHFLSKGLDKDFTRKRPFIRKGCDVVLDALGSFPWKYDKAEEKLVEWCSAIFEANGFRDGHHPYPSIADSRPQVAVAAELSILIPQLIIAYAAPRKFFREIAPKCSPRDFDPQRLSESFWLGVTLWRWGFGSLMNRNVRRAFDSATRDQLIEILGLAEGREKYREGNPVGSGKGKPKRKRVDLVATKATVNARATEIERSERIDRGGTKRAIGELARAEKRSRAAIRKRMTRASNK